MAMVLLALTITYSGIGCHDVFYSKHTVNRLYTFVAYNRYFLMSYRVEIQQYFIVNDIAEIPINRERRSLVYQHSKGVRDTITFG
tara:strand:+ start:1610 stop:1864 length:255 start_codon:yes stop_codon:yes gene_type:complete